MELTEQQFNKAVGNLATKDDLKNLVTKQDLDVRMANTATKDDLKGLATKSDLAGTKKDLEESLLATERRLMKHAEGLQEELARMVSEGFEDVQKRLDVTQRVQVLETQMAEIRQALHLSPNH